MKFNSELLRSDMITERTIKRNITMDEAATQMGVGKATVSRIESKRMVDVDTLCKVCEWLQQNPSRYFIPNDARQLKKRQRTSTFWPK